MTSLSLVLQTGHIRRSFSTLTIFERSSFEKLFSNLLLSFPRPEGDAESTTILFAFLVASSASFFAIASASFNFFFVGGRLSGKCEE